MEISGNFRNAMGMGLAAGALVALTSPAAMAQLATAPVHAEVRSATPATNTENEGSSADAMVAQGGGFHRMFAAPAGVEPSRWDFFVADSRWSPYGSVNGVRFSPLSQGVFGSVSYFKDKNLGFELQGNAQVPSLSEGSNGGSIGPVYRFGSRFSPTIHASVGAQHFVGPIIPTYGGTGYYGNGPEWGTTVAIGASGDLPLPKTGGHLAIRVQASYEYFHLSYGPIESPAYGGQVNVNSYLIEPGIVFKLGHPAGSFTAKKAR